MTPFYLVEVADPQTLAARLADDVAFRLAEAMALRGVASLVVPGGSTPGLLFDALSRRELAWDRVMVTLNDERWVDPPDPASNEHLVQTRLITARAAAARFVGLKTAAGRAADVVAEVERRLAAVPQPFDVMLLGMGEDGHTGSLFPGSAALKASLGGDSARVQAVQAPGARGSTERMTLSLPALLDSRFIALLITGRAKLDALRRAQAPGDPLDPPIRAVLQRARVPVHVYWCA
ncbi:6-phosphogluconolactonase [Caulobacter sp. S45]|uniref:6-phosphogluconolactonase n=1 Tax=Caulobacter sp. S45 TaxID=1641861 RepID=UPI0015759B00|nr:6-phosphogluconolactonase [Caulobacter sp. S45]